MNEQENKTILDLYLEGGYNCAESILLWANAYYDLGLTAEDMKLVSGFGGGLGCGKSCGALCGSIAVLGKLFVKERAHATPDFKELIGGFASQFEAHFGSMDCTDLKQSAFFHPETRCLSLVEGTKTLLKEYVEKNRFEN